MIKEIEPTLSPGERLDAVNDGIRLVSRTDGLIFGTDALLLAACIGAAGRFGTGLEIGSGSGIVSLLLLARKQVGAITALEVQPEYARLTARNAALNALDDRLTVIETDARDYVPEKCFDLVFMNPPYMRANCGRRCAAEEKEIARHEVCGTIDELVAAAGRALRYGGSFAAVYRPDRTADLIVAMRGGGIEPKRATFVHADRESEPSLLLMLGKRGAHAGLQVTPPLFLYDDAARRRFSADMQAIDEQGRLPEKYTQKGGPHGPRKRKEPD